MRILAIECATEACSLALFEDDTLLDFRHELLGRGHAEQLVPLIASLPDRGRAHAIRVSLGPGSFTGVRIGLAAARALGLAWSAEVRGYPTLALVAATARAEQSEPISVCMAGGHGEWFVQNFGADGCPEDEPRSLGPEAAGAAARHRLVAGSRANELAELAPDDFRSLPGLPDARRITAMPPSLFRETLVPIYGRPPDAALPG